MLQEDWLGRIAEIKQWSQAGVRAPHKPLLILYAIGRLVNHGTSQVTFAEAERPLNDLLTGYGSPGTGTSPQYPFRRLENDHLWRVHLSGSDPDHFDRRVTELRERATGRFPIKLEVRLTDTAYRTAVIQYLLDEHFPPSLHDDLLADVGLEPGTLTNEVRPLSEATKRPARDPRFRELVLMAYERACGFCGFDGRVNAATVGVEAAHIRWHAMAGPDEVENGIALCTLHHRLFDQGVVGLTEDHHILISQQFVGHGSTAETLVLGLVGRPLRGPQPGQAPPAAKHLAWHARQVFRGPARVAG